MRLWNCEFFEKWDSQIVNFLKNETLKLWIVWNMRLWNCDFCEKWDFENVNFVKNETFKKWFLNRELYLGPIGRPIRPDRRGLTGPHRRKFRIGFETRIFAGEPSCHWVIGPNRYQCCRMWCEVGLHGLRWRLSRGRWSRWRMTRRIGFWLACHWVRWSIRYPRSPHCIHYGLHNWSQVPLKS